ncbi:hypothetical protein CHS0354_003720 [Potamilus streckersoni]|uniref:Uncharacterized protein n=1 Tax=Potamilus streckersoni TaxID=2493646 RepID=A0AAE0SMU0_9BIVA|nr:hypothetical protein CHS0354_003720 [Potamilus streckersoni]
MISKRSSSVMKCVVVGDGGVGKTSLLLSYTTGGIMTDYVPTCFDTYHVAMHVMDEDYTLCIIDTAGQETYDRLRTLCYYETDVFIVCFSVEDPDSYENVQSKWVPEIKALRPNTPFVLVGTQTDLRGSVVDLTNACITTTQGKKLAKKLGAVDFLECSALEGIGLDAVFRRTLMATLAPKKKRKFWESFRNVFRKKSAV